jgi:hypothetical protein
MFPPYGYYAVDVRKDQLAIGQAMNLPITLHWVKESDFGRCFLRRFDVVMASCVLYHLRDDLVEEFFKTLPNLLLPGGRSFVNVNTVVKEMTWEEFPFVKRPLSFYEGLAAKNGMVVRDLGSLADLGYDLDEGGTNRMLEIRERVR